MKTFIYQVFMVIGKDVLSHLEVDCGFFSSLPLVRKFISEEEHEDFVVLRHKINLGSLAPSIVPEKVWRK